MWLDLPFTGCQDIVIANQTRGVLESQNFPNNYEHNSRCSWTIQTTMGNTINYTFTAFDLESTSATCIYDYLEVSNYWS